MRAVDILFEAESRDVDPVAIIDDRTAYGQGLANVFKKDAEKLGVKVVAS